MPWSTPFDELIFLPYRRKIATLEHAADYVMKLPDAVQKHARWQIAVENLINAAETGGGFLMFARIAMMRALNAEEQRHRRCRQSPPSPPPKSKPPISRSAVVPDRFFLNSSTRMRVVT